MSSSVASFFSLRQTLTLAARQINILGSGSSNYAVRNFCSSSPPPAVDGPESEMISLLQKRFPGATDIAVVDVSGGCGSMYEVYVEASDFQGLRMVKQHKLVTDTLRAQIKDMHGLRISTAVAKTGSGEK